MPLVVVVVVGGGGGVCAPSQMQLIVHCKCGSDTGGLSPPPFLSGWQPTDEFQYGRQ